MQSAYVGQSQYMQSAYIVAPYSKCSHYGMNLQACVINTEDFDSDGVGSGPHLQSVSDDSSLYYKE